MRRSVASRVITLDRSLAKWDDAREVGMESLQAFNFRMSEAGEAYRLVEMAGPNAPVGASAKSYELRRIDSGGGFDVCRRIEDMPPSVASAIADAFVSGVRWARKGLATSATP